MPSSRRRPDGPPPTFFVDRALGRRIVPEALERAGLSVVRMADLYADDGQRVGDDQWITDVGDRGWVALTKDAAILRDHRDTLTTSRLRVFALPNANLTGEQMAQRFELHLNRIVHRARRPGPWLDVVHAGRVERRWPSDDAT